MNVFLSHGKEYWRILSRFLFFFLQLWLFISKRISSFELVYAICETKKRDYTETLYQTRDLANRENTCLL